MEIKKKIYFKALKIRAAEEQLLIGYKNRDFGGTVHTCIGQELLPAMISELFGVNNFILSNHRGHGHYIAHTDDLESLFWEFLAKEGAPSKGIGGSQHLYYKNFLSNGSGWVYTKAETGHGCITLLLLTPLQKGRIT